MTVVLFHPAFRTMGGAELLVASQARCLKRAGLDVRVATLALDEARFRDRFEGIPVSVAPRASWTDVFVGRARSLERTVPRVEPSLRSATAVMACNFPANLLLGASSISAKRVWYCTEPSRDFHAIATNPRLYERVRSMPGGSSDAERDFATRLAEYERAMASSSWRTRVVAYDVESTKKLDSILAISEFGRGNVRRVYGRNDATIVYPIVQFPIEHRRSRSGLDRTGLKILTHSRLEIPKNIDTVVRAFALLLPRAPGSQLHVVGEGGHRKRLEKLADELGVASSVRFHGYLPDRELDRVYDACDVFALLPLDEPFGLVFPEAAARGLGWRIVAAVPAEGRLEATATTPVLRFKDDVVVRVVPALNGSRVDIRSVSRFGRGDMGANAKRVRAFLAALTAPAPG